MLAPSSCRIWPKRATGLAGGASQIPLCSRRPLSIADFGIFRGFFEYVNGIAAHEFERGRYWSAVFDPSMLVLSCPLHPSPSYPPPGFAHNSRQSSVFIGSSLIFWAAQVFALILFFVLVIGVRYRHESLPINTPAAAESGAPFDVSVVFIRNPSEHTDAPSIVVQKYVVRLIAHDSLTGEGPRRRLAWLKYDRGRESMAVFPFVWPLHWKLTGVPFDPTSYLDNPCRSPAYIGNVELTGNRYSAFKQRSGRNGVLRPFYYDVAHDQSWPLGQDQGVFADLGLARGGLRCFARLGKGPIKVESLFCSLASHFAHRAPSGAASPDRHNEQSPIRPVDFPKTGQYPQQPNLARLLWRMFRLVGGSVALWGGSRLAYLGSYDPVRYGGRVWSCLSLACLGLGLGLLMIRGGW